MKSIVTGDEMKKIEQYAIQELGISSLVLMERAALCCSEHIKMKATKEDKICVVCGKGNNGADGVTIARQLLEDDYKLTLVILGDINNAHFKEKLSKELKVQLDILDKIGINYFSEIPQDDYKFFVDAIFGIGLTKDITDEKILKAIDTINFSGAYIYSVDIPSGVDSNSGKIKGHAVKADETITFAYKKVGHLLHPGKLYAGKVFCENIGIPKICLNKYSAKHFTYEKNDGIKLLKRDENGNKGTFGKVAVIAGSKEVSGACVLCAGTVLTSGAGMVKVFSADKTLDVIRMILPEAMVQSLEDESTMESHIIEAIQWADCIVIGPGIGVGNDAYLKLQYTLKHITKDKKLVIDADGINLLSMHKELMGLTKGVNDLVYTPHMAELSRLTNVDLNVLKDDLDKVMNEVITNSQAIYVCKDSVTRVYQKDKRTFVNSFGNSGMATAGSGDVLAGLLAAILAKKDVDTYEGALLSVHLHSLAGDLAASRKGKLGVLASDISEALSNVLLTMEEFFDV